MLIIYCSFEKNVSNIRRKYLEKNTKRHFNYVYALQEAFEIAKNYPLLYKRVEHFSKMTLLEQYDTLHKTHKFGFSKESDALNKCFESLQLLPENMNTFILTKEDLRKNSILKHETLVTRNSIAIKIINPKYILDQQIEILSNTKIG